MDRKGYNRISDALKAAEIEPEISPIPDKGEDERFVTINHTTTPASVLNALNTANLLDGLPHGRSFRSPVLRIMPGLSTPTSMTFEDTQSKGSL